MFRHLKRLGLACLLIGCGATTSGVETGSVNSLLIGDVPTEMRGVKARLLFGAEQRPSSQSPAVYGNYSKGCLAGAVQLAETGPTWQAMRLSRNRNWGHPELIDYIQKLSAFAATQPGWEGLYVGDMSQPKGGPMLTGHVSNQNGIDVDIWMLPPKRLNLTRAERENLSSISTRRAGGAYTNENYTSQHSAIIKAAAQDPRTTRIFVFPGAKVRMCAEETGDRSWLRKVRPLHGHHYHFHIRLACPKGAANCVAQDPPPPGDGCDEAQIWVNNILNPPPPTPPDPDAPVVPPRKPVGALEMQDLPEQCLAVLQSE